MAYTYKYGDRPFDGVTIQRAVGRGGFGEVYYAVSDSGKQLALKYLRENPEIELRGISHVMNLKSPHLVTIYDVRQDSRDEPWVVMEYISGPSLRDILIAEPNGLGVSKAAYFLEGIASGLSYLHERGIVHRDLKPGNIFYDDGYVKIGDYGLSKHLSVSQHSGNTMSVGTVHYMAPEIGSGNYSKAIDIYALGVMLYEMLTGRLPFAGSSMGEILMRHLSERPDVSAAPEPFRGVIAKALAKDPKDRFQDVNEMVDIIKSADIVSAGLSTFDPGSLTNVPRITTRDTDMTMTAGHAIPHPPAMDVHEGRTEDALPQALGKRMKRYRRKLDQKVAKLEKRIGRSGAPTIPPPPPPTGRRRRSRFAQMLVVVAIAVASSLGLSFAVDAGYHQPAFVVSLAFYLLGAIVGPMVVYFKFLQPEFGEASLFDRLVYVSAAALFMLPGLVVASDFESEQFSLLFLPPLVVIGLCNWTKMIENGRHGEVSGKGAVWPAIIALPVSGILDAHENVMFVAAGLCGAVALLTQALAATWPFVESPNSPPAPRRKQEKNSFVFVDGIGAGDAVDEVARQVSAADTDHAEAPTIVSRPKQESAPPIAASRSDQYLVDVDAPSFVGRTANAGMSFFGKLLILAGLAWGVAYYAEFPTIRDGGSSVVVTGHSFQIQEGTSHEFSVNFPRALVFAPMLVGGFFLALARRSDGGLHFFRGFVGTVAAIIAVMLMLGPASSAVAKLLLNSGATEGLDYREGVTAVAAGLMLAFGFCMIFWPKPKARRASM
ncbi:MAG: serine/threonine-protein kinase [Phycisphaerae bacterium]